MKRPTYAMAVDTQLCVGCSCCAISCKTENGLPDGGFRSWVRTETRGRYPDLSMEVRSERCNHCKNPACVSSCPTRASYVGPGGIVLVNKAKCTGCKSCMAACPYDVRYAHPDGHVDKCTFCLHRVMKRKLPACAEQCPTKALIFGDLSNPDSAVAKLVRRRRHKVLKPATGAKPRLFFLL